MPTYRFLNTETNEEWDEFMFNSEREKLLEENPTIKQIPISFAGIGDPHRQGRAKPDDGFRDILRNINKEHRGAKLNTW